jgi:hypothetical protein
VCILINNVNNKNFSSSKTQLQDYAVLLRRYFDKVHVYWEVHVYWDNIDKAKNDLIDRNASMDVDVIIIKYIVANIRGTKRY